MYFYLINVIRYYKTKKNYFSESALKTEIKHYKNFHLEFILCVSDLLMGSHHLKSKLYCKFWSDRRTTRLVVKPLEQGIPR